MNSAAKAHEPTMEEILASIRRIISDDDPGKAMNAPKPHAEPEPQPEAMAEAGDALGQDDIDAMFAALDAPEAAAPAVEETPIAPAPRAADPKERVGQRTPITDDLDVFELTEEMVDAAEPIQPAAAPRPMAAPAPARPQTPPPAAFAPQPAVESLLSSTAGDAVSNAFGSLANTILTSNARTLDDIVKEMLRPMLREWLDDNLPPLVERLVRAEIERVARGGR